jgi:hypothetical protein
MFIKGMSYIKQKPIANNLSAMGYAKATLTGFSRKKLELESYTAGLRQKTALRTCKKLV